MDKQMILASLTPEVVDQFRLAIELGKWADGRKLTPEQRETCMQAVMVLSPSSRDAGAVSDAATKPMFINGTATALQYANRFGIKEALMVTANGDAYITPQLQERLKWLKPPPHLYRLR